MRCSHTFSRALSSFASTFGAFAHDSACFAKRAYVLRSRAPEKMVRGGNGASLSVCSSYLSDIILISEGDSTNAVCFCIAAGMNGWNHSVILSYMVLCNINGTDLELYSFCI